MQTGRTDKLVAEPAGQPRELLNDAAKLAWLKWSHGIQTRFDIKQMDVNIVNGAVGNSLSKFAMTVLRGSEKGGRYLPSLSVVLPLRPIDSAPIATFCSGRATEEEEEAVAHTRRPACPPAYWSHRIDCVDPAVLAPLGVVLRRLRIGPCREEAGGAPMAAQYAIWRERAKGHGGRRAGGRCLEARNGREEREEENKGASAAAAPFHRLLAAPRRQELGGASDRRRRRDGKR